ncbi:type II toxin-antitoxin system VapC family toxin [Necropsobacter massiliensis]|uniref:type II toxin-antitoxin system VapC family toxin n=1 Tax=Necropsobacter massiliensis TaxID=1400001 RepID=UPI000595E87F|nr:type II toxin-antitoxin system VapC family toxin [Necropsobacter massiliensis]
MFLLDTNVVSELRKVKSGKANQNVVRWFAQQNTEQIFINATVAMEIERGVLAMERKDPVQGKNLRLWKTTFFNQFLQNRILPITARTAEICAKLHIPDYAPENDAWIASSALEHRLILVTRNTTDFERTGVPLLNPFEFEGE